MPAIYLEIALGGAAREMGDVWCGDDRVPRQLFSIRAFPLSERSVGLSLTNLTAQHLAEQQAIQTLESIEPDAIAALELRLVLHVPEPAERADPRAAPRGVARREHVGGVP